MAFYYNLPTDDLMSGATITGHFGTVNADYPLNNLKDDNLAHALQYTATTAGVRIRFIIDFGATKAIRFFSLHHTNEPSALDHFSLVSSTSATPGAGTEANFAVTYAGLASDGFSIDPYVGTALAAATARQYWNLDIETLSAFATPAIGRVWMSLSLRSFTRGFRYDDFGPERGHPAIVHQTMGATLQYPFGTRTEIISGTIRCDTTDFAALKTLYDVAGESRAFPIVLDSTGATIFIGASEAMFVRFAPGYRFAPRFTPNAGPGLMDVPVAFKCVDRGLVLS